MLSRETIDRIVGFNAGDLRVLSLYLPVDPGDRRALGAEVDSLLHDVRLLSNDHSVDRDARLSLREDIERIEEAFENDLVRPATTVIFACSARGLFEVIALPRAVRPRAVVDATPVVRPMLAVLDDYERVLALVAEREWAHLWEFYLGQESDLGRVRGPDLRRFGVAGRRGHSQPRTEDKSELLERRFFTELAKALEHLFLEERYDVLVVGGHEHELPNLMELLSQQVSERSIGTFSIDPSTATTAEVREHAEAILDRHERELQQTWVHDLADSAAAGGNAALGLEPCLWAGSINAVQTLMVQEGASAPGVVCDESHWLARSGDICPVCGLETRHTDDVVEELVEAVIEEGATVHQIRVESALGKHLTGASLRFPLPPIPDLGGAR